MDLMQIISMKNLPLTFGHKYHLSNFKPPFYLNLLGQIKEIGVIQFQYDQHRQYVWT
jgi:hypothetical protein